MTSTARAHRSRSADSQVVGLLLLLVGAGWILRQTGVFELSVETTLSALLIMIGFGLVVTARNRGGRGLFWLGAGLTVALACTSSLDLGALKTRVGDRRYAPASTAKIIPFNTAIGDLAIDLRKVGPVDGTKVVEGKVVVGDLRVIVPQDAVVRVDARAGAGSIKVFGERANDDMGAKKHYRDLEYDTTTTGRLEIRLEVALGSIEVVRGSP